jgi:lipid II:glycine glycyltransferase (peptidoglycan interpeptide bridge formation enzyme)
VFSVKIDPPLVSKKWSADTIAQNLQEFQAHGLQNKRLTDIRPDSIYNAIEFVQKELAGMGWRKNVGSDSFDTVQPQFVFRLNMKGKTLDQVFADFHPLWQKKMKRAEREGIQVEVGTEFNLPEFHNLLLQNAKQEQTHVRDLNYFAKMFEYLIREDPNRLKLYLAKQGEHLLSAALTIQVNGHTWDLYSAKDVGNPDDASPYLLRWKMIQDAYHRGDHIFDFRGISTTLYEQDPLFELLEFKLGFGGEACELMGEWDYPVLPMLHWAFDMYMKRR